MQSGHCPDPPSDRPVISGLSFASEGLSCLALSLGLVGLTRRKRCRPVVDIQLMCSCVSTLVNNRSTRAGVAGWWSYVLVLLVLCVCVCVCVCVCALSWQVETFWCFQCYMDTIQNDFMEEGMVHKIGQLCWMPVCVIIKNNHDVNDASHDNKTMAIL